MWPTDTVDELLHDGPNDATHLFPVISPSPNQLQRLFGLQLDDTDIQQFIVDDDIRVSAVVVCSGDVGHTLVQRTFDDGFRMRVLRI